MDNDISNPKNTRNDPHEMLIPFRRPEIVLTLPCTMHEHPAFCNRRQRFRFKITADTPVNIWHISG